MMIDLFEKKNLIGALNKEALARSLEIASEIFV